MATKKISELTAAGSFLLADEMEVNEAGTSKKVTGTQIKAGLGPTAPVIISVGTSFTSTGVPTATLPGTHTTNDILVLALQCSNESNIAAPAGYKQIGPQNGIGAAATAGSTKMSLFWKRDTGSESAPTIPDTGDHTFGFMFAVRGCPTVGDPFVFGGNNWNFISSTAFLSVNNSMCPVDNCLVVDLFAGGVDSASAEGSSISNSDLSSVTEQFDAGTTDGTGGFLYMMSGIRAVAGNVGSSSGTWANSTVQVTSRIIFLPSDLAQMGIGTKPAEIQVFIGSPADLDDTWVMPSGGRKTFAQICDGGGSGSGGNTTTTAEGGGGGGGGGYDEAWYSFPPGTTVTVHAGKGGAAGTALNQAGNAGVVSEFGKAASSGLSSLTRIAGTAATAAASADGGNGGCGSGRGVASPAVATTRITLEGTTAGAALGARGGAGGSGTTAPTGGSPAEWGGGGGESGADTDAAITSVNNGFSQRGGGGGSGGRTNTNISGSGAGGAAAGVISAQGASGTNAGSVSQNTDRLPYGGSGGVGGGSSVVTGGTGGFPGGGGGGGAGVAGGFGGAGGHGCVVVTTFF